MYVARRFHASFTCVLEFVCISVSCIRCSHTFVISHSTAPLNENDEIFRLVNWAGVNIHCDGFHKTEKFTTSTDRSSCYDERLRHILPPPTHTNHLCSKTMLRYHHHAGKLFRSVVYKFKQLCHYSVHNCYSFCVFWTRTLGFSTIFTVTLGRLNCPSDLSFIP